jgi:hypothetical protein
METYYYSSATGETYSGAQMLGLFGINVDTTDLSILNYRGFYPVQPTAPEFDTKLYNPTGAWVIVPITGGQGAERVYTPVAKPLPEAKANAAVEEKDKANAAESQIVLESGLSNEVLTGVASQDPLARPADFQAVLDTMAVVSDQLDANLTAIDAATSVDEINAIVHQPYGTLNTGRGGPGQAGPLDLNLSYFSAINDLPGFTQADLELYVPGTNTVIPYNASLPDPYKFDSAGNCFNSGDYRLVIRYAGGGAVLSTITVPQGANTNVAWTYNPVIPSLGGGGGSSSVEEF